MTEDDFNEIIGLLDELSTELFSEAQNVSPTKPLQKYFGNWLLTRVRLHIYAAYSGCLTYGRFPQRSHFFVNKSGFRLIFTEGYRLYAVKMATGRMYVYNTKNWVEWIRRIDTRLEDLFLYTDERVPRPLFADRKRKTRLTLESFLRQGPRPCWPDEGNDDFFVGVNQQDVTGDRQPIRTGTRATQKEEEPVIQPVWAQKQRKRPAKQHILADKELRDVIKLVPGEYVCKRCFYFWVALAKGDNGPGADTPAICPRCKSPDWNAPNASKGKAGRIASPKPPVITDLSEETRPLTNVQVRRSPECQNHRPDYATCKCEACLQDTWVFSIFPAGWRLEDSIQILVKDFRVLKAYRKEYEWMSGISFLELWSWLKSRDVSAGSMGGGGDEIYYCDPEDYDGVKPKLLPFYSIQ
jgi:hypothetical protein